MPATNDGSTMAQFFGGKDTLVCDDYGIKNQNQFLNTLYDNIKTRGLIDAIITDSGKSEISKKVADLLRSLFNKHNESDPISSIKPKLNSAMVSSRGTLPQ